MDSYCVSSLVLGLSVGCNSADNDLITGISHSTVTSVHVAMPGFVSSADQFIRKRFLL